MLCFKDARKDDVICVYLSLFIFYYISWNIVSYFIIFFITKLMLMLGSTPKLIH